MLVKWERRRSGADRRKIPRAAEAEVGSGWLQCLYGGQGKRPDWEETGLNNSLPRISNSSAYRKMPQSGEGQVCYLLRCEDWLWLQLCPPLPGVL